MKLIIRVVIALVVAVVLLLGALLVLPGEKLAQLAASQIEKQTGRTVTFGGRVGYTLWPTLGVKADRVALSNADWAGPEPMLTAERLTIGIAAADLIGGKIRVTELSAVLPQLNLSTRADGTGNWVLGPVDEGQTGAAPAAEGRMESLPVSIEALNLTGASLRYAPHGETPIELTQVDLALQWPEPNGTVLADITLRPAGAPVQIAAEIGTFEAFLAGQVASVGASVTADETELRFDGRANITGAATGRLTGKSSDLARSLAVLGGAEGVETPAVKTWLIASDLTYTTDGRLALRDLTLEADANRLRGAADVVLGDVPKVTARLSGDQLDFSALLPAGDADLPAAAAAGTGTDPVSDGWSRERMDFGWLAALNAAIALDVQGVDTGTVKLGPSKLDLALDNSRAVLKFLPASVFDGQVQGQLVVNNRNGLSVGGKLSFQDIRLEQALGQTMGYDRLNGEALGELEYLGVGNSVAEIMSSLSGKGWLEVGKGFFTGFDLEQLMRSGSGNGGSTVFDQLTASYTMEGGNLLNRDLLLTLRGLRAEGEGRIGLGAQDLDYLFTPGIQRGDGSTRLSIPVAITGPWSDPKIRPDLKRALEPEIDAVEQQAKDRLREKLSEELDTEIAPERDINEAIRDRIEKEAKDQLLRLLGGD
ncbi:AsmA family protein [Phaeobacter sp. S60]|uniref:AsmA family protein n=1 Tax=Phaeobacter sp. S60 TaxID=1569353 RepID=UPI00058EA9AE|nr:AsmA family protein [Phaeobacter sp. S60]KII14985.1 cell envelope biogenesis protein AsmA [Phaeobacter sp. S60]